MPSPGSTTQWAWRTGQDNSDLHEISANVNQSLRFCEKCGGILNLVDDYIAPFCFEEVLEMSG